MMAIVSRFQTICIYDYRQNIKLFEMRREVEYTASELIFTDQNIPILVVGGLENQMVSLPCWDDQ